MIQSECHNQRWIGNRIERVTNDNYCHRTGIRRGQWNNLEGCRRLERVCWQTAGEALDALPGQLSESELSTLVIVQRLRPDQFFTADQRKRLETLMARWRTSRDGNGKLDPGEQTEVEALVEAELEGATRRTEAVINELP
jgi:hypothetical protein